MSEAPRAPSVGPLSDQRDSERMRMVAFAWYHVLDFDDAEGMGDGPREGIARSCDVSHRGIGLVTSREVRVGARVFIQLVTPDGRICLIARVVHSAPADHECYRMGLRIEVLPPTDRGTLHAMIDP